MSDLKTRIAQAIATQFTSEHKYVLSTERRGYLDAVPATLAERAEMAASVAFDDTDGERSIRFPTCNELADAVMPIVVELAADLDSAERDNRRLAAENKRLKGEANT